MSLLNKFSKGKIIILILVNLFVLKFTKEKSKLLNLSFI